MTLSVHIEKRLGDFRLQADLETAEGTMALLGRSGSGKSLTLRCIAGIERPDRGRIVLDGRVLFDAQQGIDLPPQQRQVGLMPQNYALFPHMTVRQNILCPMRREKDRGRRERTAERLMERFGLTELAGRYPRELSGGEQQRTALARMLASSPKLLLLDEPFSALDSHLRAQTAQELRAALSDFGGPVLLVSHDRNEVFRMADRIAVLEAGRIETCGAKREVFAHPETRQSAVLTGCGNISAIGRRSAGRIYAADWGVELTAPHMSGEAAYVGIHAHHIRAGEGENALRCRVAEVTENPFSCTVLLRPADCPTAVPIAWEVEKSAWERLQAEELTVCLPAQALLPLREN